MYSLFSGETTLIRVAHGDRRRYSGNRVERRCEMEDGWVRCNGLGNVHTGGRVTRSRWRGGSAVGYAGTHGRRHRCAWRSDGTARCTTGYAVARTVWRCTRSVRARLRGRARRGMSMEDRGVARTGRQRLIGITTCGMAWCIGMAACAAGTVTCCDTASRLVGSNTMR